MREREGSRAIQEKLSEAVFEMDEEKTVLLAREIIQKGYDAYEAVMNGLAVGMSRAGEAYNQGIYFVPELLLCSDALYAGLDVLRPNIETDASKIKGKVVIGVVQGDIHDIGKNLVKTMFDAEGWEVYDLGKDVQIERFAQKQMEIGAELVAISALMTTSMLAMPKVIQQVKNRDPGVIVLVGGAPLTAEIAAQYGADGYADNAKLAVKVASELLEKKSSQWGKR
jgi:methanogenic corrinoid protein MtbC1